MYVYVNHVFDMCEVETSVSWYAVQFCGVDFLLQHIDGL